MRGGIIDLGSNSFRLLVADAAGPIEQRAHYLGLARSVSAHGSLTKDDLQLALLRARELVRCAEDLECVHLGIVATEAFRLASNGAAAIERLSAAIEHPIKLLNAEQETALAFRGAAQRHPHLEDLTMVDVGGGSLGIASGHTRAPRPAHQSSYELGIELIAQRALDGEFLSTSSRVRLETHIAGELGATLPSLPATRPVVLVGGSVRALARVIHTARRGEVPADLDGLRIDCTDLGHLITRLAELTTPARLAIGGMSRHRAETMPLAAAVVRQTLRSLGVNSAIVSTGGLREGAIGQLHQQQRRAA